MADPWGPPSEKLVSALQQGRQALAAVAKIPESTEEEELEGIDVDSVVILHDSETGQRDPKLARRSQERSSGTNASPLAPGAGGAATPPDARTQKALNLLAEVEALAARREAVTKEEKEGDKAVKAAEIGEAYDAVCSRFVPRSAPY